MKKRWFMFVIVLCAVSAARAVPVSGSVLLENQQNNAGIKVTFIAASPSAQTDSAFTDSTGHFAREVVPGIYDVQYSKNGFFPFVLSNQLLVVAHVFNPITLPVVGTTLAGRLSGTLGPGRYFVVNHITVPDSQSLTIQPGTKFFFAGQFRITVNGSISALGSLQDSIVFTRAFAVEQFKWRGIRIETADAPCALSYCRIEYGRADSSEFLLGCGGGLYVSDSPRLTISHCVFRSCAANFNGGAINFNQSDSVRISDCLFTADSAQEGGALAAGSTPLIITNTVFDNNRANDGGAVLSGTFDPNMYSSFSGCTFSRDSAIVSGGALSGTGTTILSNCIIYNNGAGSNGGGIFWSSGFLTMDACTVRTNTATNFSPGGGIRLDFCRFNVTNSVIRSNSAGFGGGLFIGNASSGTIANCVIVTNHAYAPAEFPHGGGGIHMNNGSLISIRDSRIAGNTSEMDGGGIIAFNDSLSLTHCTISGNSTTDGEGAGLYLYRCLLRGNSTIISHSTGSGIYFQESAQSAMIYSDFFANSVADFRFANNDPTNGPPAIGLRVVTNHNADSADVYLNIFADPLFVDRAARDFHLQFGSPCIDAGDPALPRDPDNTICDMGMYYFDQSAANDKPQRIPEQFSLAQNYPNPFNPATEIIFSLPRAQNVSLKVFDLLGREVAVLTKGTQTVGEHHVRFDGRDLPSGTYLYRLESDASVLTRKMLLVK
jgi:hypothetical protein